MSPRLLSAVDVVVPCLLAKATIATTTPATSAKKESPMRPTHTHSFNF
jgi:hypothetical protein